MKGIEKITNRIREEAEADAAAVIAEANAKAEEILGGYREQAKQLYDELHEAGLAEAAASAERKIRNDQLRSRKATLGIKHVLVKDAYRQAHQEILNLPEEEYLELLTSYAVKASSSGKEKVQLNEKDRARLGEKLIRQVNARLAEAGRPAGLTLDERSVDIDGGLLLTENDISVNCSIDVLVDTLCEKLDRSVAGILFG